MGALHPVTPREFCVTAASLARMDRSICRAFVPFAQTWPEASPAGPPPTRLSIDTTVHASHAAGPRAPAPMMETTTPVTKAKPVADKHADIAEPPAEIAAPIAAAVAVAELVRPPPARPADMRPGQPHMQNGRPVPPSRAAAKEENFVQGDFVVYPTHGVGKVDKIAVEDIAGHRLELIHITFEENRMTLRVPVAKARTAGLRKLATRKLFDEALAVLKGRARIKRTMWSRRAQEYEAKINSGDPIAIAEVVRDLHRNSGQPDQSFSERQIYEAALDRLAAELAALDKTDKPAAIVKLIEFLKAS